MSFYIVQKSKYGTTLVKDSDDNTFETEELSEAEEMLKACFESSTQSRASYYIVVDL